MITDERIQKIKSWVEKTEFPDTLDGKTKYYTDVNNTIEMWVAQLYSSDEDTKQAAFDKISTLARDLTVKENWNKPHQTIADLTKNK